MKQNNVKLNARLNAIGNAYAKATGMPIVGEMMMAAGGISSNAVVVSPVFLCTNNAIYFYVIVEEPFTEGNMPTVKCIHDDDVFNMRANEALEIDENTILDITATFPDFDFTDYLGYYLIGFITNNVQIEEGDTYTFTYNGKTVETTQAVCIVVSGTEEQQE